MSNMTKLEAAMALLMTTFEEYAGKEGKKDSLNKAEVKTMMNEQLPGFLGALDELMKGLDHNNDQEVDFQEFVVLIATLTCACHGRFCKN
ncbi:hypothetical protein CRUP_023443 [Coryphaenoides rupestris]|nr:hypothetical protein CRUP_023443 [Coryphaenoides rupestris]